MKHYKEFENIEYETFTFKKVIYANIIFTLDIEVTSYFKVNDQWITAKNQPRELLEKATDRLAIPYIWQFGINDTVYYGRSFRDFTRFFKKIDTLIPEKKIVFIHNLSYEFAFLSQDFKMDSVFARKANKPMYAIARDFNVEYRCTYMLSMMSLDNLAKSYTFITHEKELGGLDYEVARLPNTPLSQKELSYCEHDILVMCDYLKYMVTQYKNLADIPYTQTSVIRKPIRHDILGYQSHKKLMNKIKPTFEDYAKLTEVMRGGITQCNWVHLDTIKKDVYHADIASSYPYIMVTKFFPMSKWEWHNDNFFDRKTYLYIYHVKLYDISPKSGWLYIPIAKTKDFKKRDDDLYLDLCEGKIASAAMIDLWVTDIDLDIIKDTYNIGKIDYIDNMRSRKGRLPIPLIKYILQLYADKTKIKNIEELSDLYMHKKQELNGIFGMMLTNIFRDIPEYLGFNFWNTELQNWLDIKNKLDSDKPFLNFSWGIYVTAYARKRLFEALNKLGDNGIYCDTDSAFFNGKEFLYIFDDINKKVINEIEYTAYILNIDKQLFMPKDKDGITRPIGFWEVDNKTIKRFKSVGSKKYIYETQEGKVKPVVAGCKKTYYDFDAQKKVQVIKSIEEFNIGAQFKNGRSVCWYTHDQPLVELTDYLGNKYVNDQLCGIVTLNTPYTLGITPELDSYTKLSHNFLTNPYRFAGLK